MQREAGDLELSEGEAEGASGIGLLDAARQRALAAHAEPVGVGEVGAGKRPGGKDQGVLRRHWLDAGRTHIEQGFSDEISTGTNDRLAMKFFRPDRTVREIDV